jgi:N-acetylneuraminic acid mutarotase
MMSRLQLLSLPLVVTVLVVSSCEVSSNQAITAPESDAGTLDAQSVSLLAASNTWTATHSLLQPRAYMVAGTINSIIYVVAGLAPTGTLPPFFLTSTVQAYRVATNTWSLKKSLPAPRAQLNGASVINGRLYVTGGSNSAVVPVVPTKTLYVYTPGTNTWARKADLPQAGWNGAQGVIAGLLYVYVGRTQNQEDGFFRYTPITNTWIRLAPPPTEHSNAAVGVIGGKFYLAGGQTSVAISKALDVYNPATNTWTTRAPMPQARSHMASTVINGQLFVASGVVDNGKVATALAYNPSTNTWATKASMPAVRAAAAGAAANGLFFVLGGLDGNDKVLSTVRAYAP